MINPSPFFYFSCDNDTTIQHFGYGMRSVQRFSIQAFRFLTQHRFVYMHCDLVVCNRNSFNSTCARGNTCSRRYRRDVNRMSSSDDSSPMYPLSFGPLMYSKESDDDKSTGWYCIWTTKCLHTYTLLLLHTRSIWRNSYSKRNEKKYF